MKEIHVISVKNISKTLRLNSIKGKKVMAANGEIIGKVKDVAFDAHKVQGIYVENMLIDMYYVDQFEEESIVLKINPVIKLKGKIVFDNDGKKIGRIIDVIRNSSENLFSGVIVKKNFYSKKIRIPHEDMAVIDKNIILKKSM
jgi:sporulation protein YlmC with PRC-barrel domain